MTALALMGVLAACSGQGTATSSDPATSGAPAASAGSSDAATTGGTGTASAACTEAFAPLAEMQLTSMSELGDLSDDVQPTVEACESVSDWIAGASAALGTEVNPGSADFLLRVQCDDLSLARTPICEELG